MTCDKVHSKLAGYLDDSPASAARPRQRDAIRQHLEECESCREELQRYRKLAVMISRMPRALPPADLAVRIKVAAAQGRGPRTWAERWQMVKDRMELLQDNVFRPLTVPATGGLFSAIVVFVFVLHMIVPGIVVQADPNDVPTSLLQPAGLIALSDLPSEASPEMQHPDVALDHDLKVDVVVDAEGRMIKYEIMDGPDNQEMRHHLDQMLIFSRFRPMLTFGRPISGGHVVLSFSAVYVRG
jgi:hypothetical protein